MVDEDIDEWLDSWIESHHMNWGDAAQAATACLAAAEAQGISERELNAAAGGDLVAYLQDEAQAIAEASGATPEGF